VSVEVASRTGLRAEVGAGRQVALIDLLDRLLQGGISVQGDITLCAAGIDLVRLDLRLLIAAIDTLTRPA
jgi:hypothetical protein